MRQGPISTVILIPSGLPVGSDARGGRRNPTGPDAPAAGCRLALAALRAERDDRLVDKTQAGGGAEQSSDLVVLALPRPV